MYHVPQGCTRIKRKNTDDFADELKLREILRESLSHRVQKCRVGAGREVLYVGPSTAGGYRDTSQDKASARTQDYLPD